MGEGEGETLSWDKFLKSSDPVTMIKGYGVFPSCEDS